jgi:hypothetical protein
MMKSRNKYGMMRRMIRRRARSATGVKSSTLFGDNFSPERTVTWFEYSLWTFVFSVPPWWTFPINHHGKMVQLLATTKGTIH